MKMLSIMLGIVLAIIVYGFFNKPIRYVGPNSKDIVDKEFIFENKKYRLEPFIV